MDTKNERNTEAIEYRMQVVASLDEIARPDWQRLAAGAGPFLDHRFLHALQASGSVGPGTGWQTAHVVAQRDGRTVAVCPQYRKSHSYGEYVFDWAWADAYHRHGLRYYPKGVVAVPFTPVPGARLLAEDAHARAALAMALPRIARQAGWSSSHVLFTSEDDARALRGSGAWLERGGIQFHWTNDGYASFDDYLAALTQPKRKKIRAERRKVAEQDVHVTVHEGPDIDDALWALFMRCYERTYAEHHSTPYLNAEFFGMLGRTMPEHLVMFVARRGDHPVACSLLLHDDEALYGRYWGAVEPLPFVHFETSYYAPIAWAISRGIKRFEGGAQGEHKLARGFLPVPTRSFHWLSHPAFSEAVAEFLAREGDGVAERLDELNERSPMR